MAMRNTRNDVTSVLSHVVLIVGSILAILPLLVIFLLSLYPASQPITGLSMPQYLDFSNYARAWGLIDMGQLLLNSVAVAIPTVILTVILSFLSGFAFGTMDFRFKRVLFVLFILGLVMPFFSMIVPLYFNMRSLGLVNTLLGVILVKTALFLSFGTSWMRGHFESIDREMIEAAQLDGAGSVRTLVSVLLPNSRPAIMTLCVLVFMWSWNEFFLVLVLIQTSGLQTAPVGLSYFMGEFSTDIPALAAGAVMVAAPVLLVYVFLQRHFIQGVLSGAGK